MEKIKLKFYSKGLIASFLLSVIYVGLFGFLFGFSIIGFSIIITLIVLNSKLNKDVKNGTRK